MNTLNYIAEEVAGTLDRPFDVMLKERIKSAFRHIIATLLRQEINKTGIKDSYTSRFQVDVIKSSLINSYTSNFYMTLNKIPKPLVYNTDDPFTYVGDINGTNAYIYSKLSTIKFNDLLAMNINKPSRYIYNNEYIYIYNVIKNVDSTGTLDTTIFKLEIEGVYPINDLITPEDKLNSITFSDDTILTFPEYLVMNAKELLLKLDLSITDSKDKVKPINIDNV